MKLEEKYLPTDFVTEVHTDESNLSTHVGSASAHGVTKIAGAPASTTTGHLAGWSADGKTLTDSGSSPASFEAANSNIQAHISSASNPHATTAAQVGADISGAATAAVNAHKDLTTGVHGVGTSSIASMQNIQDVAANRASYYFNGVDTHINTTANAILNLGASEFTLLFTAKSTTTTPAAAKSLGFLYNSSNGVIFQVLMSTVGLIYIHTPAGDVNTGITIPGTDWFILVIKCTPATGKFTCYFNGVADAERSATYTTITAATSLYLGNTNTSTWQRQILRAAVYNYSTNFSVEKIGRYNASAKTDWKDIGGSMTQQTSGTLVIGKMYRSFDWISDDDFTNVSSTGASANVDGAEWTCIATTPTKWTNASKLIPLGCVLDLEPEGIVKQVIAGVDTNLWLDSSTNGLNGTATGAQPTNQLKERITAAIGATTFTNSGQIYNVASIVLPRGQWQLFGKVAITAPGTTRDYAVVSISETSVTEENLSYINNVTTDASVTLTYPCFPLVVTVLGASKTVYLTGRTGFTGTAPTVNAGFTNFYAVRIA